jgi:hypothetical protein
MEQKFEILNRAIKLKNQQLEDMKISTKCPFEKRHEYLQCRIDEFEAFLKHLQERIESFDEKTEQQEIELEKLEENLEANVKIFKGFGLFFHK